MSRGYDSAQRLSGQATTAIGNVIVNMIIHRKFVQRNYDNLQAMMFLGDDNIALFKNKPNIAKLSRDAKLYHNMQAKASIN